MEFTVKEHAMIIKQKYVYMKNQGAHLINIDVLIKEMTDICMGSFKKEE